MTSYEIVDVTQGTDEWLAARAGLLTASTIGQLLTPKGAVSKSRTGDVLLRRLGREKATGRVYPIPQTWPMRRGSELEAHARDEYQMLFTTSPVFETGLLVRTFEDGARLGYSPDAIVGNDGLLEIKCPSIDRFTDVVLDNSPLVEHVAQLQAGLLVTGRAWIDYMVFYPGEVSHVIRVEPNPVWQDALRQAATMAHERIAEYAAMFTANTADNIPPSLRELDDPYTRRGEVE